MTIAGVLYGATSSTQRARILQIARLQAQRKAILIETGWAD